MKHECEQMKQALEKNVDRIVDGDKLIDNYGPAITHIEYVSNMNIWVAHCYEYATAIKYCPFCGEKLPVADLYLK